MTEEITRKRSIKSYVLRQGRLTGAQSRAIEELWPKYGIDLSDVNQDWQQQFQRTAPLIIEIGFGMGSSLIQQAQIEQDKNFLGIEVHRPGVGACLQEVNAKGLENIKVMNCDAIAVFEQMIVDQSVSRIQLYFPDPWHKKKHHKRRIVKKTFIDIVGEKLEQGGVFHMATDWQPYAESMLSVMQQENGFCNMAGTLNFVPRPDFRPVTKFEKRGLKLGHGVWDLIYKKL